jgi:hypothetical protein
MQRLVELSREHLRGKSSRLEYVSKLIAALSKVTSDADATELAERLTGKYYEGQAWLLNRRNMIVTEKVIKSHMRKDRFEVTITKTERGYDVDMWTPDDINHWSKSVFTEEEALEEYKRWEND